jgi:predicted transcriptional regulator
MLLVKKFNKLMKRTSKVSRVSCRIENDLDQQLRLIAKANNRAYSVVLRAAIAAYLIQSKTLVA